jgi:hypothetical protein
VRYQLIVTAALLAVMSSPAVGLAQSRVEVSANVGWTVSDGLNTQAILAGDGQIYDAIDVKDAFSWGFGVGINLTENAEAGFLFSQQMSTLGVDGTRSREIGDMNINSYHPYFAYNFGEVDATVRPFVLGGLGATNYAGVEYTRVNGQTGTTGSETQFSTLWAAGVKVFPSPKVGLRIAAQWIPTYIKSDAAGWWCDPYWGCYLVGDAKYANQFQFSGGVTFRF